MNKELSISGKSFDSFDVDISESRVERKSRESTELRTKAVFVTSSGILFVRGLHRETSVTGCNISFKGVDVSTCSLGSSLKRNNGHSDYIQFIYHVVSREYQGESHRGREKTMENLATLLSTITAGSTVCLLRY